MLHDTGVYVLVPAPQRYAIHKLIISRRRREDAAKRDKDTQQAEALLEILAKKQPYDLKSSWEEAIQRGPRWRKLLAEGLGQLRPRSRDVTLKVVDGRREMVPGLDLTFNDPPPRHDFSRDIVEFDGEALGARVRCAISRAALDDHFETNDQGSQGRIDSFLKNRTDIENMARIKYRSWPIEEPEAVLIKTMDVPKLLKEFSSKASSRH
jgi:hypothetical protein